jgi:uncharacterized iron-regulated membrane protein
MLIDMRAALYIWNRHFYIALAVMGIVLVTLLTGVLLGPGLKEEVNVHTSSPVR